MEKLTIEEYNKIIEYFLDESQPDAGKGCTAFLHLYEELTEPQILSGSNIQVEDGLVTSHEDVREAVTSLRTNSSLTRLDFGQNCFSKTASLREVNIVIAISIQLGFMLNCNLKDQCSKNYNIGKCMLTRWENDESFQEVVSRTIPRQDIGTIEPQLQRNRIIAWKLKNRCDMEIHGTDNLCGTFTLWSQRWMAESVPSYNLVARSALKVAKTWWKPESVSTRPEMLLLSR